MSWCQEKMEHNSQRNPIRKTLQVLNWMVEALPAAAGVREMAQALGVAPSTVHRILGQLEEEQIVQSEPDSGRYRLGVEFFRLAWRATSRFSISSAALPLMRELVAACNETAILGVYDSVRQEMIFTAAVESQHPLRYVLELNKWLPVYAGATGLAIMAFLPEQERREIVTRTRLAPLTERTVTDPARLEREMEQIRRQGYAITRGQRIPGAVGMGAPIWGPDGRVVADLALTIPEHRFEQESEGPLAHLLMHHAQRVTDRLGMRMPTLEKPFAAGQER